MGDRPGAGGIGGQGRGGFEMWGGPGAANNGGSMFSGFVGGATGLFGKIG